MKYNYLKFEKRGRIGILTLDRPKALNALNEEVFKDLTCFLESENVNDIRVLIITGEGKALLLEPISKPCRNTLHKMPTIFLKQASEYSI
nr:enoyl-CoA hydratase/isomerase family protein [Marinifilum fragile]